MAVEHLESQRKKAGLKIPDPRSLPSARGEVSEEEWRLRCDLAATYRLVALHGWDDMVFTHISARCPDEDGAPRFLINPFGLFFWEITASSLVKIDIDGKKVGDFPYFANPAGFTIHSAVHSAREDARCVIHLHTEYGMAVSAQREGLRRLTQHSMIVHDDIAYHDYEGIALDLDERERLIADLGDKSLLILRNHGTLTVGDSCASAFLRMFFLEKSCKAQILAQCGGELIECSAAMSAHVSAQARKDIASGMSDALAWPGLLRMLDRHSPGFDA